MVMVFPVRSRVTKAIVKTRTFPEIGVAVPDALVVIRHGVGHIEDAYSIGPNPDMSQSDGRGCSSVLLRGTRDLKNKVLVGGDIGIAGPGTNAV